MSPRYTGMAVSLRFRTFKSYGLFQMIVTRRLDFALHLTAGWGGKLTLLSVPTDVTFEFF
jgi:hypothetical protein